MAFGFGFNKTKVLASAERNVKQGKLQAAIGEYERILAEDPKDLTVMNTVGDLYARVGNTEKATEYFKKIGDSYAGEGFTVRAIAMYKKLTKQNPNAHDAVLKLGDLYTQQGLYNDARAQYMQVAEHRLRNNELQQAASVFQKTLELDPENSSLQTRLAELFVKIGRAADARDLYFRNAEALRARGALDLADDALSRVVKLDPNFGPALLMRGQVRFDSGDPEGAIQVLEQLPDIDSRPEGLRTLLKAQLSLNKLDSAEPIARKLLQVYNDPSGIAGHGEALMAAGQNEKALEFFVEHSAILLASNQPAFMQSLQALTARVKSNPACLEKLADLFQRAGNTGLIVEVNELLAHACVQQGDLAKARDLYQRLTQLEPDNPQHAQNYKQIAAKLSDSVPPPPLEQPARVPQPPTPPLRREEPTIERELESQPGPEVETSSEPFATEETLPVSQVEQKYPADITELIEAALTDAELFDSYNLISKAIAPLEILLPRVPNDVRVNQRLASLYARSGRLKEAAERCAVLEKVHVVAGFLKDSRFYAELGGKYRQRAGSTVQSAAAPSEAAQTPAVPTSVAAVLPTPVPPQAQPVELAVAAQATPPAPVAPVTPTPVRTAPPPPPPAVAEPRAHEIDLSSEWEQMLEVEHSHPARAAEPGLQPPHVVPEPVAPPVPPQVQPPQVASTPRPPVVQAAVPPVVLPTPAPLPSRSDFLQSPQTAPVHEASTWDDAGESSPVAELLDEVRFYISQGMWPEARTALSRCELVAPDNPEVLQLSIQIGEYESAPSLEGTEHELQFEGTSEHETGYETGAVDPLLISSASEAQAEFASPAPDFASPQLPVHQPVAAQPPVHEAPVAPVFQSPQPPVHTPPVAPVYVSPEPVVNDLPAVPVFESPSIQQPPAAHRYAPTEAVHDAPAIQASAQPHPAFHQPTAPPQQQPEPVYTPPAVELPAVVHEAPVPPVHLEPPVPQVTNPVPVASPPKQASALDTFVQDLEASLGDFSLEPPGGEAEPHVATAHSTPKTHVDEIAHSAAPATPTAEAPVPPAIAHAEPPIAAPPPPIAAVAAAAAAAESVTAASTAPAISQDEERTALNDIFAEFKESMESDSEDTEDPETHYNLGVAFKEMDLFDEAIGEFQKVCQAIEHGYPFAQSVQAFTWLADCFLKKGEPDLAVRWYERALKSAKVDYETDTAIRYELACACAAAGDRQSALDHFMEVYGTNIDYRDVAERIKSLRS